MTSHAALASGCVGAAGCVLAFEASPATFSEFAALKTRHPNVRVRYCAVADRDGELEFNLDRAHHTGMASLREFGASSGSVRVKAVTLDALLGRLPKLGFVKINVEGAEVLVLRGMRALVARDRPVLALEVTPAFLAAFGHGRRQCDVASAPDELLHTCERSENRTHCRGDRPLPVPRQQRAVVNT